MAKRKLNAFERQFVANRRAGKKTFSFGGKSYNTKLAGKGGDGGGPKVTKTKTKAAASTPTPTARPSVRTAVPAGTAKVPTPTPRPDYPPRRPVDAERTARDVGGTRKQMELVTGSPHPRGTPIRQAVAKPSGASNVVARPKAIKPGSPAGPRGSQYGAGGEMSLTPREVNQENARSTRQWQEGFRQKRQAEAASKAGSQRLAADVADTRKRMELAIGSPSPRGTPIRQAVAKPRSVAPTAVAAVVKPRAAVSTSVTKLRYAGAPLGTRPSKAVTGTGAGLGKPLPQAIKDDKFLKPPPRPAGYKPGDETRNLTKRPSLTTVGAEGYAGKVKKTTNVDAVFKKRKK